IMIMIDIPTVNPLSDAVIPVPEDPTYAITLDVNSQVYLIAEAFVNALQGRRPAAAPSYAPTRTTPTTSRATPKPQAQAKPKPKPKPNPKKKDEIVLW